MLNMDKKDLIHAIENIEKDAKDKIEWNLEFIYQDCVYHRGNPNYELASAYQLIAKQELNYRKEGKVAR
tara:strand:+ start:178 stop:384 length:207 start_codon:yes stop_codon:yes gene_type:complete